MPRHILVVGAGVGGLATALRLAHGGDRVTIFEKQGEVGGRNRPVRVNGCVFDGGPTLMMMLDPFRRLFADVGERMEDHLKIHLCDPNYRVFFGDGSRLDSTTNLALMIRRIADLAGEEDASRYPGFLGRLGELYRESIPRFVRRNYDSPLDLVSAKSLRIALRHGMLGNLAAGVARTFRDERLRQLFCLQTMYLGLSPYHAPWVYGTLAYMEYAEGIWYPEGGLPEISRAIARLAEARGVEIRLNSPVCAMDGKSVQLESGETVSGDAVVCNADLPYAERALLRLPIREKRRHSCSAYMMYLDYEGDLPEIPHHSIFLGKDFFGNLDQIFRLKQIPDDPAFYCAVTCKTERAKAPEGHSDLFVLVPCPHLDHPWTDADAETLRERAFARLERETSFRRENVRGMKTTSPRDWADELNLDKGAAFGLSHDLLQSVCFRPSNRSRKHPGLYYVGASTNPGNGLPMVLIGAELVAQRLGR